MRVLYSGLLRSPASWARVGRELVAAVARLGIPIAALRMRGFLHDPRFPLPEGVTEVARDAFPADVELTFAHPALYGRLRAPRRVGILVYEADRLPPTWVPAIREHLDLLLVPSEFCRRGAIAAGVPSHLVRLLAFGVNPQVFHTAAGTRRPPLTFLCVAAPHVRKGLRELLAAYRLAFRGTPGVRLILKTTYDPGDHARRFPWELEPLATELAAARLNSKGTPWLQVIKGSLDDQALARLYAEAHVYVQSSYGEGFGLALLEAAAAGCAPILTGWGASAELFGADAGLCVDHDIVNAAPYEYGRDSGGLMARPCVGDLARAMRRMHDEPALVDTYAARAALVAAHYTWDRSGRQLVGYLEEICRRPPAR